MQRLLASKRQAHGEGVVQPCALAGYKQTVVDGRVLVGRGAFRFLGDEFYVLYEELYLGEEFIGPGEILAAEFINQGERYQALLYTKEDGESGYYSPEGKSMRKAFLRAPVEFSRISSNFNLRRVHPLFKRTMPPRVGRY